MTLSEQKRTETWDKLEWYALSHTFRSDVATLLKFRDGDEAYNPLYLFWNLYQPEIKDADGNFSPAPNLRLEDEQLVLDALDLLRHRYRVSFEPDADVSALKRFYSEYAENPDSTPLPSLLKNLLILIHVAAAKAFRLINSENGYSEETKECLAEVERTFSQLCYTGFAPPMCLSEDNDSGRFEGVAVFKSALSATSLSFVELAGIHNLDGNPSDGLRHLVQAQDLYSYARPTPMGIYLNWPLGVAFSSTQMDSPMESRGVYNTWSGLAVSQNELAKTWQLIRDSASSIANWAQIAMDCKVMALSSDIWRLNELEDSYNYEYSEVMYDDWNDFLAEYHNRERIFKDEDGFVLTWGEFWEGARTWASAQLSPSEYRRMREQDKQDAAENRLKRYFFRDTWDTMPEQAKERLITADVNWNSNQRMSREAILNDLLRATEAMCSRFIWQPLANSKNNSREFLHFLRRDSEIAENPRRSQPEVRDFIWVCEQSFFLEFIEQQKPAADVVFLTEDLPSAMRQLADERGSAEHDTGNSTAGIVIESTYQLFLGIGRPGILPKFARFGSNMQPRRSRNASQR